MPNTAKHGHTLGRRGETTFSPTYNTWRAMIQRCRNPNNNRFYRYGARGITVCESWRVFKNFLDDMGERPAGKTLDRKNNNKGYSKGNCRWATPLEQRQNRSDAA